MAIINEPITREQFQKQYGYDPLDRQASLKAQQSAAPTATPKQPNLGQKTGQIYADSAKKIGESIGGAASKLATQNAQPLAKDLPTAFGQELGKAGTLLEGGLGAASGVARATFAPVEAGVGALSDMTGLTDLIHHAATSKTLAPVVGNISKWAEAHPEAARNLSDALTVGGAAFGDLGGAKNPLNTDLGQMAKGVAKVPGEISAEIGAANSAKNDKAVMNLIMEKPGKKDAINAFKLAGQEGGVAEVGRGKKFEITPTAYDQKRLESVRGIIDPKRSHVENNTLLNNEIKRVSTEELEPYLQQNPRIFNVATVNNKLRSLEMPDLFKSDETLSRTYNLVRQRMVNAINDNPKNMEGLWQARKQFDREVVDQFGDAVFNSEKNTAIKRAIQDMRGAVNGFIGDEIGDGQFKALMGKLSDMYTVRDNIAEKAFDLLHTGKYARIWKGLSPAQKKLILIGTGVLGTLTGGKIVFAGD